MADKHTAGPLHVGGHDKCTIYDKFGQRVGNTFEGVMAIQRSDAECRANALLFSAAPELLEALEGMCIALENIGGEHVTGLEGSENRLRAANAAIAKATGATP